MSWLALTTASSTAITPISVRLAASELGRSRAMAPITITRVSCSTSNQPRRRSGHCKGQRSSNGAQNILSV